MIVRPPDVPTASLAVPDDVLHNHWSRRSLSLAIAVVLAMGVLALSETTAFAAMPTVGTYTVSGDFVNLRSEPTTQSRLYGNLRRGTRAGVVCQTYGEWAFGINPVWNLVLVNGRPYWASDELFNTPTHGAVAWPCDLSWQRTWGVECGDRPLSSYNMERLIANGGTAALQAMSDNFYLDKKLLCWSALRDFLASKLVRGRFWNCVQAIQNRPRNWASVFGLINWVRNVSGCIRRS